MKPVSATQRALVLAVVLLQSTIAPIVMSGLIPNYMGQLTDTFGASRGQIGTVLAVTVLIASAFGLLAGSLAERIGNERVLVIAIGGQAITAALFTFVGSTWAALLLALAFYSTMNMTCVANAVATDFFVSSRKRGVNLLHAINSVGKLAGPVVALIFAAVWRWGFFATGIYGLVLLAMALTAFRGPVHRVSTERLRNDPVLHRPLFWVTVAGFALLVAAEFSVAQWLPTFLTKVRGFSGDVTKILHACFMAGLVSGRFGMVLFGYRFSHRQVLYGCIACALFLLPAMWLTAPIAVGVFLFLHGIAFSAAYPTHFSYITRFFPRHVSALSGGSGLSRCVGFATAYFVSGWISDWSPTWAVLTGVVMMAAYGGLVFGLDRFEKRLPALEQVPSAPV